MTKKKSKEFTKVKAIRDTDLDVDTPAKGCKKADKTKAKNREWQFLKRSGELDEQHVSE